MCLELNSLLGSALGVASMDIEWRHDPKSAQRVCMAIRDSLLPFTYAGGAALVSHRNLALATQGSSGSWGYRQLATLVNSICAEVEVGGAHAVLLEVEAFVKSWGWLKVL